MAPQSQAKLLRIGVFQGDRQIEERLIRKRGPVTIGQTLSNTFVIPTSAMPKTFKLFDVNAEGHYVLRFTDRMGGRISLDGKDLLDLARSRGGARNVRDVGDGVYEVALTPNARGKVTIGSTRLLFQFVSPAPVVLAGHVSGGALSSMRDFLGGWVLAGLLFSLLAQYGPLLYITQNDWPRIEGYEILPDWEPDTVVLFEEEEEDKPEEEPDQEPDPTLEAEVVPTDVDPTEQVQEAPAEARAEPERNTPAAERERPVTRERQTQSYASGASMARSTVLGIDDGGVGGFAAEDLVGSTAGLNALEGMGRDTLVTQNGSGDGDGLTLEGGGGDPTGSTAGIREGGGGGGNGVVGGGPSTATAEEPRERVEVEIDDQSARVPSSSDVAPSARSEIERVFRSNRGHVERCYRRIIQRYGDAAGKLELIVTIGRDGSVMKVAVRTDEIGHGLGRCVEGKIKRWDFPATGSVVPVGKRWVFGTR